MTRINKAGVQVMADSLVDLALRFLLKDKPTSIDETALQECDERGFHDEIWFPGTYQVNKDPAHTVMRGYCSYCGSDIEKDYDPDATQRIRTVKRDPDYKPEFAYR